jgi:hypothetical protein
MEGRKGNFVQQWTYGCELVNKFSPCSLKEREGCPKKLRVVYRWDRDATSPQYELWSAEGTHHEHNFEIGKGPRYSLVSAVKEHYNSRGSPYNCREFVASKLGLLNAGSLTKKEKDQIHTQLRLCHKAEFGNSSARNEL